MPVRCRIDDDFVPKPLLDPATPMDGRVEPVEPGHDDSM
jgi:hypothetical protein